MPVQPVQLDPKFEQFLKDFPQYLAKLVEVLKAYYEIQTGEPKVPNPPNPNPAAPKEWNFGDDVELTTHFISHEEVDALLKGYAEATVKEKAIAWIKGFIMGITLIAGVAGGPAGGLLGAAGGAAAGAVGGAASTCASCGAITNIIKGVAGGCGA
jgi:hypothetical protein